MSLFKNKHLIMAMFVAPVLAVIAYFAVDNIVSEKPHAAVEGASYKLVAKSNCRYKSGICTLKNGDIEVKLYLDVIDDVKTKVVLSSEMPIQNAVASFVNDIGYEKIATEPVSLSQMKKNDGEKYNYFSAIVNTVPTENSLMRLAVNISDVLYYAETTTVFIDLETSFTRDNFSSK